MLEIIEAGGWVMGPILACSVAALAIILERAFALRRRRVIPAGLVARVWELLKGGRLDANALREIARGSPLGRILAAGLSNRNQPREVMKETLEDVGRQVVHELDRYLNTLGTIAAVSPLLGLYGTVLGMIKVFTAISEHGVGQAGVLAGGIAEALITTAAGLTVAIPALMFHRYFRGRVDGLVLHMELETLKVVEVLHGERSASTLEGR